MKSEYHEKLKISKNFPKEEIYGITSQLRRATLSIILNYIEGYSRFKKRVIINFLETSYGSLKESKYLLNFCLKEDFISQPDYEKLINIAEEIGAMLWTDIKKQNSKIAKLQNSKLTKKPNLLFCCIVILLSCYLVILLS